MVSINRWFTVEGSPSPLGVTWIRMPSTGPVMSTYPHLGYGHLRNARQRIHDEAELRRVPGNERYLRRVDRKDPIPERARDHCESRSTGSAALPGGFRERQRISSAWSTSPFTSGATPIGTVTPYRGVGLEFKGKQRRRVQSGKRFETNPTAG
jgi:hypothetical protein